MEDKITLYQRKKTERLNFSTEVDLKLDGADKVLFVTDELKITAVECVEGEIRISGRIDYTVVYSSDGVIDSVGTGKDFLEKISADVDPSSSVYADGSIESTEWHESGDYIKLRSDAALYGWYVRTEDVTVLSPEGAQLYTEVVSRECVYPLPYTHKELSGEVEVVGGIEKLLSLSSVVKLGNVKTESGIAYIEGETVTDIIYLHDGKIFSEKVNIPFSHEVVGTDITADSRVVVYPSVRTVNVLLGDGDTVIVETDVGFSSYVINGEDIEVLTDAYVIGKETLIEETSYTLMRTRCTDVISEKISDSVRLKESGRTVVAVTPPSVSGLNVTLKDNKTLLAEGVLNSRVIYISESGDIRSALIEIPFQSEGGRDCEGTEAVTSRAYVNSYYAKLRMNDEIEFNASLLIEVEGTENVPLNVVTGLTVLGDIEDEAAISLYIVNEGDTLFSVAKTLNVSEDVILSQNEDLELPLKTGSHVIVYKELD